MDKVRFFGNATVVQRLLERIQRDVGAERTRHPPADDAPGKSVDDERHVHEAAPGRHIRQVSHPQPIRRADDKVAVHPIQRHDIRIWTPPHCKHAVDVRHGTTAYEYPASVVGIRFVADALPRRVLFIIDEAYADYLPDEWKTGVDLIREGYENVVVTRTFSKVHGMAGLRTGYGIGHPDVLNTVQNFGCGPASTSIVAFGAVQGALSGPGHPRKSREYVEKCIR